ncbi:collagen alpha-1(I) chain-like [Cavia porcellus]|uniref:collagen alpha-1(I) chain-like n=1 Tax=Cavia porcellus TaxID=10141 RepID=UPI002FDFFFA4
MERGVRGREGDEESTVMRVYQQPTPLHRHGTPRGGRAASARSPAKFRGVDGSAEQTNPGARPARASAGKSYPGQQLPPGSKRPADSSGSPGRARPRGQLSPRAATRHPGPGNRTRTGPHGPTRSSRDDARPGRLSPARTGRGASPQARPPAASGRSGACPPVRRQWWRPRISRRRPRAGERADRGRRGREHGERSDAAGPDRSAPSSRGLLPPPLAGESPPGPLLPPPMQPGMNAQRRLAYPEVKHPSASSIRIGAGPGSEHTGKKNKRGKRLSSGGGGGGCIGPPLPAAAKRAEPSRRLHRPVWIGQITNRKAGSVLIGWRGF